MHGDPSAVENGKTHFPPKAQVKGTWHSLSFLQTPFSVARAVHRLVSSSQKRFAIHSWFLSQIAPAAFPTQTPPVQTPE
jgi:hypothetical protein